MEVIKLPKKFRMVCYEIMDGKEALDSLESFSDKYPHQVAAVKAEIAYFHLDYEQALKIAINTHYNNSKKTIMRVLKVEKMF